KLDSVVNTTTHTINAHIYHFSIYSVLAYNVPATYTISNLSISPNTVNIGSDVTVNATVTNVGDISGTDTVSFKVNGTTVDSQDITLEGKENKVVSFTTIADTIGSNAIDVNGTTGEFAVSMPLQLPIFKVKNLSVIPTLVAADNNIMVNATVANDGDLSGIYTVNLKVDGIIVNSQDITLAGKESKIVTFTTTIATAGNVIIDLNGLTKLLQVQEKPVISIASPEISLLPVKAVNDDKTGKLQVANINYQMYNLDSSVSGYAINLKVDLDGNLLEIVPLLSSKLGLTTDNVGNWQYIPPQGWKAGTYDFKIELTDNDGKIVSSQNQSLKVLPTAVIINWWILLLITVIGLLVSGIVVVVVIRRRRQIFARG
ncbi:MAG TPA: CARDB domain-containing protein, partial [Candidatus Bathyarchaeia archaeon]|nr:CARDB domain-containing protein [Candidatus Bathyarchaeia archaeon]